MTSYPNESYTVGWICAVVVEYLAAQLYLDEEHERPKYVSDNDNNDYTLGRIGKHNVVLAVLPNGEYGTTSATGVAKDMLHTFPNVRIGLMVGIGGGAPSPNHDIRLGDIVVSAPRDGKGGVLQYDFGKRIQEQNFKQTGFLNKPPTVLLAAVSGLETRYQRKQRQLENAINSMMEKNKEDVSEDLRKSLSRPDASNDKLYQSHVIHPPDYQGHCTEICAVNATNIKERPERTNLPQSPRVHYGRIASGNQLMKDATVRDMLAAQEDILCFEMEAAGLMNQFPCLVIRGICDYSDSHKNKDWQGYAAIAAAAYAKDLLYRIAPNQVKAERRIGDILPALLSSQKRQENMAEEGLAIQTEQLKKEQTQEENKCHQLFRLTAKDKDITYEWYKDRVEERVEDTCNWFLQHAKFRKWLAEESGLLLVTADPGCGKSVLARYLIDHALPRSTTICYFFFKDQDQNTLRQALCALIHQLFSYKPALLQYAIKAFERNGDALIQSTASLWNILHSAIQDPQAGPITIVLDALDECTSSDFKSLIEKISGQFEKGSKHHSNLKYLLTCRPYGSILSEFRNPSKAFQDIHIPGEEKSEEISEEIDLVISYRLDQLAAKMVLSAPIKRHLGQLLQAIPHRTYLWVHLIFDSLQKTDFKRTAKGVESKIAILPQTVNEAYNQILCRAQEPSMVRKVLSIILAASRPLSLSELNIVMGIEEQEASVYTLDVETNTEFKARLRSWCGLFVSIHQEKVYFLHQTAREFLLAGSATHPSVSFGLSWQHSISTREAHEVLAKLCVAYLDFFNSSTSPLLNTSKIEDISVDRHAFKEYAAESWGNHFREASILKDDNIIPFALSISNNNSNAYAIWFRLYCKARNEWDFDPGNGFTDLLVASHFGHTAIVETLLDRGVGVEAQDSNKETALSHATKGGYTDIIKLLLDKGADVNAQVRYYGNALYTASHRGYREIIKLLLDKGADVNAQDAQHGGALQAASEAGHEQIVKLLLNEGAEINAQGSESGSALQAASVEGHEQIVKLLLNEGADINAQGGYYGNALQAASFRGHQKVVQLLLDKEADVNAQGDAFGSAIYIASHGGHQEIVGLLLDKGADVNAQGGYYGNALQAALQKHHQEILKMLLDNGADVNAQGGEYGNALEAAFLQGDEETIKLLLDKGADINILDDLYGSALQAASLGGHKEIVKLLLDKGVNVNEQGGEYGSALQAASLNDYGDIIKLLLDKGADINAQGGEYGNALQAASINGYKEIVKLFLDKGADVNSQGGSFHNALYAASSEGHYEIVKLLLDRGAEVKNSNALVAASSIGHQEIIKLLLENGAEINAQGDYYGNALQAASHGGHEKIIKLLLDEGADVNAQGGRYGNALQAASHGGHEKIIKLLLDEGADVNAQGGRYGNALQAASDGGHEEIVKLLKSRLPPTRRSSRKRPAPTNPPSLNSSLATVQGPIPKKRRTSQRETQADYSVPRRIQPQRQARAKYSK